MKGQKELKQMNIVVLAGGISTERSVSIVSGTQVCKALRKRGHKAILLDVYFGKKIFKKEELFQEEYDLAADVREMEENTRPFEEFQKEKREFFGSNVLSICKLADITFLALHGEDGENGKVQAAFDLYRIPYTGADYLGSAMAMDKALSKKILSAGKVPVPRGFTLAKGEPVKYPGEENLSYPLVVKPCCGGSSVGVFIVDDDDAYKEALKEAFLYEKQLVVETCIRGREFSVGVVEGKAYPVIEIEPIEGFYDYKNKYEAGKTIETCPAKLSEEETKRMQDYAEAGFEALCLKGYARLDFLMNEQGEMFCLEANTLPGMTPTSLLPQEAAALGMSFEDLCEKLIEVSLKKYL